MRTTLPATNNPISDRSSTTNDNHLRWRALIMYRTDSGHDPVEVTFEEIEDLHDIIEQGPSWDTIIGITIQLARPTYPNLTVEAAARL